MAGVEAGVRRSATLMLMGTLFLMLCSNGLSFLTGVSVGWLARGSAASVVSMADTRHTAVLEKVASPSPTSIPSPSPTLAPPSPSPGLDTASPLELFTEAWEIIEREFYAEQPWDRQQAAYSAIRGLVTSLGDPHTRFAEPSQHELDKSNYAGKFGGIGAWIALDEQGRSVIARLMEGMPAESAGLQVGDLILQIDRQPVKGLSQDEIVLRIRGPVGSVVELGIQRAGQEGVLYFSVTRVEIKQPTVSWKPLEDGNIAYIQLTFFAEPTADELEDVMREIRTLGISRVILDLRDNRGGLLGPAGEVAGHFIREGVLLYERRRSESGDLEEEAYMIPGSALIMENERLVVLVGGGTASAAEIVAGAIQDYGRGTLIGEKTFGKGSMQYVHELSDQSSLHVTAAHWLTPKKRRIQGEGLTPDIEVTMTTEDLREGRDPQIERAIEYLREGQ